MDLFIPDEIKKISRILNEAGYQCFLVGGAIRNQLLGKEAKDFDLTTDAEPESVMKLFKKVIPTGIKHGTVTILMGNHGFEITTYRIDGKYTDGRRPDKIEFTPSIEEDLLRRDFTINSIALNIETLEILDINHGIRDLEKKSIRAIGVPSKRFDEDALRLVRACRFAAQLDFDIEEETYKAMSSTLEKLPSVSKERIAEELLKILSSSHPSVAFKHFYNCGMLEILFPDISDTAEKDYKRFTDAIADLNSITTSKPYIRFARLLYITPLKRHQEVLKGLKLSNNFINSTLKLISFIDEDITKLQDPYQARLLISRAGINVVNDLIELWSGMKSLNKESLSLAKDEINNQINRKYPFFIKDLKINGKDLIREFNMNPGPEIGSTLELLLDYVLKNPDKNSKEELSKLISNNS